MLGRSVGFALAVVLAQVATAWAADGFTLKAEAGLRGICKPGRWTPVRVFLATETQDIEGELTVEWGNARVTRAVDAAAPSRRRFELYVRTGDARDTMIVRLLSRGRELYRVDVPLQLAGTDDPLTVCGASSARSSVAGGDCSAVMAADTLPQSWRGYDAATDVRLGSVTALTASQRRAIEIWRAVRSMDDPESPGSAGVVPPASPPASRARGVLTAYLVAMGVIAIPWGGGRLHGRTRCVALLAVGLAGTAATAMLGRSSPVLIHHSTVAQQFDGAPGALIMMRAVAEYPIGRRFGVTASVDGAIDERSISADRIEERFDTQGRPLLDGVSWMGSTREFTLEGTAEFRALDVSRTRGAIRVTNVSKAVLTDCELPTEFPAPAGGVLRPGEYIEASRAVGGVDRVISCRLSGTPVEFSEPGCGVQPDGSTTVLYHFSIAGTHDDPY